MRTGKKGKESASGRFVDRLGPIRYNEPAFIRYSILERTRAAGGKELRDGVGGSEEKKKASPPVQDRQAAASCAHGLFPGRYLL